MKRVLVTGAQGMLGHDIMLGLRDAELTGYSRTELDIRDEKATREAVKDFDVVINAAAYTAVDAAETHEQAAFDINAVGPQNLAQACNSAGATLLHISTDYVFDGHADFPYEENSPTGPVSVYGKSKLAGEQAVLEHHAQGSVILRTSWLYGLMGSSFPRTILTAAATRDHLDVVSDQVGQPTWTRDVVTMMNHILEASITQGIFHATNSGQTSWHGFATRLFELAGWDTDRVHPTTTEAFPRPAPRPSWSVLGHSAWESNNLPSPRPWGEALDEAWELGLSVFTDGHGGIR